MPLIQHWKWVCFASSFQFNINCWLWVYCFNWFLFMRCKSLFNYKIFPNNRFLVGSFLVGEIPAGNSENVILSCTFTLDSWRTTLVKGPPKLSSFSTLDLLIRKSCNLTFFLSQGPQVSSWMWVQLCLVFCSVGPNENETEIL